MKKNIFLFVILTMVFSSCEKEEPIPTYTLSTSVSPIEGGKIFVSPQSPNYKEGEMVTLTAEPNEHWVFEKWEGDEIGNSNPLEITMMSDKSVVGVFVKRDYALNLTIEGEGTVEEKIVTIPAGREYPHGTTVELTPVPKEGWVFESWGGDLSGTESPKTITVDKEKKVTVKFKSKIVLYFPFDGNSNDESGNGFNGIVFGALLSSDRNGKENSAFYFDGINDVIDTKKNLDVSVNFSVSFWAKPIKNHQIDLESNNQKCCVYSGGSGQNYIMYPAHGRLIWGNNDHAGMGISMGKNGVSIYEHRDFHQPAVLVWKSPTEIIDWTHIVVNYKNNKSHLYVNGKLVKVGLASIQKFVHPSIGNPENNKNEGIGGGLNQFFNGFIDELVIFNTTLNENEINKLFNEGIN